MCLYRRIVNYFNPQGSREPRQPRAFLSGGIQFISIHKALASLDLTYFSPRSVDIYFNPQGSREPRRYGVYRRKGVTLISIHKALASLDVNVNTFDIYTLSFQSTRLSRACMESESIPLLPISIHKALASLDLAHSLIYPVTLGFQSTRLSRASTCRKTKTGGVY